MFAFKSQHWRQDVVNNPTTSKHSVLDRNNSRRARARCVRLIAWHSTHVCNLSTEYAGRLLCGTRMLLKKTVAQTFAVTDSIQSFRKILVCGFGKKRSLTYRATVPRKSGCLEFYLEQASVGSREKENYWGQDR